jgi:hypothetical protein
MAYFGKRHFISDFSQVSFSVLDLDTLIEEFEKCVFYNPFKIFDPYSFVQGFACNEI